MKSIPKSIVLFFTYASALAWSTETPWWNDLKPTPQDIIDANSVSKNAVIQFANEIFIRKDLKVTYQSEQEYTENPIYLSVVKELSQALPYRISPKSVKPLRFIDENDNQWRGFQIEINEADFAHIDNTPATLAARKLLVDTIYQSAIFISQFYARTYGQNRGLYYPRTILIRSTLKAPDLFPSTSGRINGNFSFEYDYAFNKLSVDLYRTAPLARDLFSFWDRGSFFNIPAQLLNAINELKPPSKLEMIAEKAAPRIQAAIEKKKNEIIKNKQAEIWQMLVNPLGNGRTTVRKIYIEYFKKRTENQQALTKKAKAKDASETEIEREESELLTLFSGVTSDKPDFVPSPGPRTLTQLPVWQELAALDAANLREIIDYMEEAAADPALVESLSETHSQAHAMASIGIFDNKQNIEIIRKLTGKPIKFNDFEIDTPALLGPVTGDLNIDLDKLELPNGVVVANYKDIHVTLGQLFAPLSPQEQQLLGTMKNRATNRTVKVFDIIEASVIVDPIDVINVDLSLGDGLSVDTAELERNFLRTAWLRWQKKQIRLSKKQAQAEAEKAAEKPATRIKRRQ